MLFPEWIQQTHWILQLFDLLPFLPGVHLFAYFLHEIEVDAFGLVTAFTHTFVASDEFIQVDIPVVLE